MTPSPNARSAKECLADALGEIGQPVLAHRARQGEFDDYESPHPFPQTALVNALQARATAHGRRCGRSACAQMIERVKSGEFDATKAERPRRTLDPYLGVRIASGPLNGDFSR